MKYHPRKVGAQTPLLLIAILGAGCSQSPNPNLAAFAQAPLGANSQASEKLSRQIGADHQFQFKADKPLKSVSVVGTFNKWNKTANPMTVDADGVTWRISLPLSYGKYVYKFVQFDSDNKENWIPDPNAPLDETDKVNNNSVLVVTPAGYNIPASPTDGKTATDALLHLNGTRDLSYEDGRITLSLRARPNDVRSIEVKSSGQRYPMKLTRSDDMFAFYNVQVPWNGKQDLTYSFELADGNRVTQYGANGTGSNPAAFRTAAKGFKPYLLTDSSEPLRMEGPLTTRSVTGPSWAINQPIYEVNLDLYKFPKGTALREYEKHLPVLKQMGVGLVWFMPLYPRGYKKGFGSPYAVRDYQAINPDLGTKAEFKHLVETAHKLGLRVLMDFVPNHTSWDNAMIEAHPEFYVHDAKGEIAQAQTWADTAQLDYGRAGHWNQPLWNQMRDNMTMWVRDFNVDGFRCDVAGSNGAVPAEFWNWLRPQLNAIKPVFMLAEADNPEVFPGFDMTYSWSLPPVFWDICAGRKPALAIDDELRKEARKFPDGAVQMRFLDNHDWHAHADWGWGNGPAVEVKPGMPQVAPLMVLCATLPGKPLLYNGQEMSFEKVDPSADVQASTKSPVWPFYRSLLNLYQSQPALSQGRFSKIVSNNDAKIYAFTRQRGQNRVLVVVNLSDQAQTATLKGTSLAGNYTDGFSNQSVYLSASPSMNLAPWGYRVYVGQVEG
jgi:1,4-alpha-glucan branching enzyme